MSMLSLTQSIFRDTQRVRFGEYVCSEGLNLLKYSDLIAVKARDFFGETSPHNKETD